jgi:hypothetical protein
VKDETVSEVGVGDSPEPEPPGPDEESADRPASEATEGADLSSETSDGADRPVSEATDGGAGEPAGSRAASSGRRTAFAVSRGLAVLVVAAVGYQLVVPQTHVVRARLSRLVLSRPGVARYNVKTPTTAEQPASTTQLSTVESAATKSPNQTGVFTISWSPSQTSGAGILVYLLPTTAQAKTVLPQVRAQQAAAGSYTSEGLTRRSTFTVTSVPGSSGATYTPTSKGSGLNAELSIATFQYGRVVGAVEVIGPSATQADSSTIATSEYDLLRRVEPGFTLKTVTRPVLASSLWVLGAVLLAAVAALTPAARRRLAARRQRKIDEELSHVVVVKGQTISKHRR